jgi:hypothetical protein
MLLFSGQLETYNQMKRFIEGFNWREIYMVWTNCKTESQ